MNKKRLFKLLITISAIALLTGCSAKDKKVAGSTYVPTIDNYDKGFSKASFISTGDDFYKVEELFGTKYEFSYDLELKDDDASFLLSDGYGQYGNILMVNISDNDGVGTLSIDKMVNGKIAHKNIEANETINAINGVYHVDGNVDKNKLHVTVNDPDMGAFNIDELNLGAVGAYIDRGADIQIYLDNIKVMDGLHNIVYDENFSKPLTIFAPYYVKLEDGKLNVDHGVLLTKLDGAPAPVFVRDFEVKAKKVKNAYIYMTALGSFDIYLNNNRIEDNYLDPGYLLYKDHLNYVSYDVTDLIEDNNNLNIVLTHGFYDRAQGYPEVASPYGDKLALKGELVIEYRNGDVEIIPTDEEFKVSNSGAVRFDDIYQGEIINASYSLSKGDLLNVSVDAVDEKYLNMEIYEKETPSIKEVLELTPVSVNNPKEGVYVYDFGQNFSGTVKLTLPSEDYTWDEYINSETSTLTFRYGETVNLNELDNKDDIPGTIWTRNLGTAKATDYYILGDNEDYRLNIEFLDTYHGFRYLQLEGLKKELPLEFVKGKVLSSALTPIGDFTCSNAAINRFYENSKFSILSNFMDNPSDCNQRDERLGWSGDAQVSSAFASYLLDTDSFYNKYIKAMVINQTDEGAFPETAPNSLSGYGTNCWGDAPLVIAWNLYTQYGDKKVIADNYDAFKRWVDYLVSHSDNYIRLTTSYGDHLSMQGTPFELTDTAWSAHSADLLSKMAKVLNNEEDAAKYTEIFNLYKKAWQDRFIRTDGSVEAGLMTEESETGYALGICFNLFDDEMKNAAVKRLALLAEYSGYEFYPGYSGLGYLLPALGENGEVEAAYKLLTNTNPGSLLYNVATGMTTLTESLYAIEYNENGHYTINGSLNHHAYAGVSAFFYSGILGIKPDEEHPGYEHFYVSPVIDSEYLTSAMGSLNTSYGPISVSWEASLENGTINVKVPEGTTCTLTLTDGAVSELNPGEHTISW